MSEPTRAEVATMSRDDLLDAAVVLTGRRRNDLERLTMRELRAEVLDELPPDDE